MSHPVTFLPTFVDRYVTQRGTARHHVRVHVAPAFLMTGACLRGWRVGGWHMDANDLHNNLWCIYHTLNLYQLVTTKGEHSVLTPVNSTISSGCLHGG